MPLTPALPAEVPLTPALPPDGGRVPKTSRILLLLAPSGERRQGGEWHDHEGRSR